jgi:nitrite reductase/ring-hydroxylating ferredoxin subunit
MSTTEIRLCATADLEAGSHMQVQVPGVGPLAVYHVEDRFYVTADPCTHMQASLGEEGALEGYVIQCTWHNGRFDVRTGEVLGPPCPAPLRTYPVIVRDGTVYVDVSA